MVQGHLGSVDQPDFTARAASYIYTPGPIGEGALAMLSDPLEVGVGPFYHGL
jgi:hypothetical protein